MTEDLLWLDVPSPEEWPYPTLTFDSDASRRRFERTLIDKRDYYQSGLSKLPEGLARDSATSQIDVLETMIDRLGRQTENSDEFEFQSPSELNVALMAANWVYVVIQETQDEGEATKALDNVSELVAVMAEAHWLDDDHVLEQLETLHEAYGGDGDGV